MAFINLTPHTLNVFSLDGQRPLLTIKPSGETVRVQSVSTPAADVEMPESAVAMMGEEVSAFVVPTVTTALGQVEGLPASNGKDVFLVSGMVLSALRGTRDDVLAPGDLVRDEKGRPCGCKGLRRG
jgi:hypothetical protein